MDRQDRLQSILQLQDFVEYSPLDHPVAFALFPLLWAVAPAPPFGNLDLCQAQCASAQERARGREKGLTLDACLSAAALNVGQFLQSLCGSTILFRWTWRAPVSPARLPHTSGCDGARRVRG